MQYTKDKDNTGQPSADEGQSWNQDMPSRLLKTWLSYKVPKLKKNLRLGLGVQVQSELYAEREASATLNAVKVKPGGYAVWDGFVSFDITKNWQAHLKLNNILDKR